MNAMTVFERAEPYVVGLGIPVMIAALSIVLPVQFAQQGALGELKATLNDMRTDLGKLDTRLTSIDDRFKAKEEDPQELMSKVFGVAANSPAAATVVYHDGKLIALPKTEESKQRFISAGYAYEAVTPTISGFVLETSTDQTKNGATVKSRR